MVQLTKRLFTIIGSGFGLYGYLPALCVGLDGKVVLPERYRDKVVARPELSDCLTHIRWVGKDDSARSWASAAVVATCPEKQHEVILQLLKFQELKTLLLEKPVASDPEAAASILNLLKQKKIRFRIGYTFLNSAWYDDLKAEVAGMDEHQTIGMSWCFLAHHFRHNLDGWKCYHARGGGVLRFFGIHLVALLADLGYDNVTESRLCGKDQDQPEKWEAVFTADRMPDCRVMVDSRSPENHFSIHAMEADSGKTNLVELSHPFAFEETTGSSVLSDNRIVPLIKLVQTLDHPDEAYVDLYDRVNELWLKVEAVCTNESPLSV